MSEDRPPDGYGATAELAGLLLREQTIRGF